MFLITCTRLECQEPIGPKNYVKLQILDRSSGYKCFCFAVQFPLVIFIIKILQACIYLRENYI
jgi:hypothetical protein